MKILPASDYKRMPWKNGGGVTVEIAVFPPDASVNDFDWRISMATVATDGPFSIFPDIDRTLSILDGNGMKLSIDGQQAVVLERDSNPLAFAADVPVDAVLSDGPITDLNVMTRRGVFEHSVEHIGHSFDGKCGTGEIIIILPVASAEVLVENQHQLLGSLDAAIIADGKTFQIRSVEDRAFLIRLKSISA